MVVKCPMFGKPCIAERCAWWTGALMHKSPGDEPEMVFNCAIVWIPHMMKEGNRLSNGAGGLLEQIRNRTEDTVKATVQQAQILAGMATLAIERRPLEIEAPRDPA